MADGELAGQETKRQRGGRSQRRETRLQGGQAERRPYIVRGIPTYDILSDESLSRIEATADRILAEIGIELREDAEAMRLYRLAAEQGDAPAQDMLSWMLLECGVPADRAEALRWAQEAAEAGIATSMTRLGMIHHDALGVERDAAAAAQWWQRGMAAGDPDSEAMLGAATLLGQGVPADAERALALLLAAEARGSRLAAPFIKAARAAVAPAEPAP